MKWWAVLLLVWFGGGFVYDLYRISINDVDAIFHAHWPLYVFVVTDPILFVMVARADWAHK